MISNVPIQPSFYPLKGESSLPTKSDVSFKENSIQSNDLSEEEKAQVERLKKTDREVRAHEQAHKNSGGQFAGSASYSYTVGPDGNRYATGGEVPIDIAPIDGDPEATIAKLDVVIAAALAPAKPSAQDRKVAAAAVSARNKAQAELLQKKQDEKDPSNLNNVSFDVNDFGNTPNQSINKAYNNSNELTRVIGSTGQNFSVTT